MEVAAMRRGYPSFVPSVPYLRADDAATSVRPPCFKEVLGDLRRLAAARFALDDNDVACLNSISTKISKLLHTQHNLLSVLVDWQRSSLGRYHRPFGTNLLIDAQSRLRVVHNVDSLVLILSVDSWSRRAGSPEVHLFCDCKQSQGKTERKAKKTKPLEQQSPPLVQ
mgnify:FL=1